MPFTGGKAQMRALFAKDPKLAKRWVKKYGVPKDEGKSERFKKARAKARRK
jgi:hypothetical protein